MEKKKKVLIIDDEPDLLEMMTTRLKDAGYQVAIATDGDAGFKKAKELRPDAILLDVVLPKLNGWEVCTKLRADPETAKIRVAIFTASNPRELERHAKEVRADAIIQKPFEFNELFDFLEGRI